MKPTRLANQILADADGPDYGIEYRADSWDTDAYLKEISGDGFEAHRQGIMENVRDDLCNDRLYVTFMMSAIGDNPTSSACLDVLAVINQSTRRHAAKQLEEEVYTEGERRAFYDPTDDQERDMVDEFGGYL